MMNKRLTKYLKPWKKYSYIFFFKLFKKFRKCLESWKRRLWNFHQNLSKKKRICHNFFNYQFNHFSKNKNCCIFSSNCSKGSENVWNPGKVDCEIFTKIWAKKNIPVRLEIHSKSIRGLRGGAPGGVPTKKGTIGGR